MHESADWHTLIAARAMRSEMAELPADEVDHSLLLAIDALLMAARLCGGWRVCAAAVWVAYRVGVHVGRRARE